MKVVSALVFVMMFGFSISGFALESHAAVGCRFPDKKGNAVIESCVEKQKDGSYKISVSALKQIMFDKEGLVGGYISPSGCYWLHKSGTLRKTHCFDSGADYFQDGLARFIDSKGRFGYMNKKLKIKIPAQFTFAFPFESGYAKVCNDCVTTTPKDSEHALMSGGQWMVIDKSGKVVTTCKGAQDYDSCHLSENK